MVEIRRQITDVKPVWGINTEACLCVRVSVCPRKADGHTKWSPVFLGVLERVCVADTQLSVNGQNVSPAARKYTFSPLLI